MGIQKLFLFLFICTFFCMPSVSWSNALVSKDSGFQLTVEIASPKYQTLKVCSQSSRGRVCHQYPKYQELLFQDTSVDWDFMLRRCNVFLLTNRVALGSELLQAAAILAATYATGGGTLLAGAAGGVHFMASGHQPYPDFKISEFPSDKKRRELAQKQIVVNGMDRAKQLIDYILTPTSMQKSIPEKDLLALQQIVSTCSQGISEREWTSENQSKCLRGCHGQQKNFEVQKELLGQPQQFILSPAYNEPLPEQDIRDYLEKVSQ